MLDFDTFWLSEARAYGNRESLFDDFDATNEQHRRILSEECIGEVKRLFPELTLSQLCVIDTAKSFANDGCELFKMAINAKKINLNLEAFLNAASDLTQRELLSYSCLSELIEHVDGLTLNDLSGLYQNHLFRNSAELWDITTNVKELSFSRDTFLSAVSDPKQLELLSIPFLAIPIKNINDLTWNDLCNIPVLRSLKLDEFYNVFFNAKVLNFSRERFLNVISDSNQHQLLVLSYTAKLMQAIPGLTLTDLGELHQIQPLSEVEVRDMYFKAQSSPISREQFLSKAYDPQQRPSLSEILRLPLWDPPRSAQTFAPVHETTLQTRSIPKRAPYRLSKTTTRRCLPNKRGGGPSRI